MFKAVVGYSNDPDSLAAVEEVLLQEIYQKLGLFLLQLILIILSAANRSGFFRD